MSCPQPITTCACSFHTRRCTCAEDDSCPLTQIKHSNPIIKTMWNGQTVYLLVESIEHYCQCRSVMIAHTARKAEWLDLPAKRHRAQTCFQYGLYDWIVGSHEKCLCGGIELLGELAQQFVLHQSYNQYSRQHMSSVKTRNSPVFTPKSHRRKQNEDFFWKANTSNNIDGNWRLQMK